MIDDMLFNQREPTRQERDAIHAGLIEVANKFPENRLELQGYQLDLERFSYNRMATLSQLLQRLCRPMDLTSEAGGGGPPSGGTGGTGPRTDPFPPDPFARPRPPQPPPPQISPPFVPPNINPNTGFPYVPPVTGVGAATTSVDPHLQDWCKAGYEEATKALRQGEWASVDWSIVEDLKRQLLSQNATEGRKINQWLDKLSDPGYIATLDAANHNNPVRLFMQLNLARLMWMCWRTGQSTPCDELMTHISAALDSDGSSNAVFTTRAVTMDNGQFQRLRSAISTIQGIHHVNLAALSSLLTGIAPPVESEIFQTGSTSDSIGLQNDVMYQALNACYPTTTTATQMETDVGFPGQGQTMPDLSAGGSGSGSVSGGRPPPGGGSSGGFSFDNPPRPPRPTTRPTTATPNRYLNLSSVIPRASFLCENLRWLLNRTAFNEENSNRLRHTLIQFKRMLPDRSDLDPIIAELADHNLGFDTHAELLEMENRLCREALAIEHEENQPILDPGGETYAFLVPVVQRLNTFMQKVFLKFGENPEPDYRYRTSGPERALITNSLQALVRKFPQAEFDRLNALMVNVPQERLSWDTMEIILEPYFSLIQSGQDICQWIPSRMQMSPRDALIAMVMLRNEYPNAQTLTQFVAQSENAGTSGSNWMQEAQQIVQDVCSGAANAPRPITIQPGPRVSPEAGLPAQGAYTHGGQDIFNIPGQVTTATDVQPTVTGDPDADVDIAERSEEQVVIDLLIVALFGDGNLSDAQWSRVLGGIGTADVGGNWYSYALDLRRARVRPNAAEVAPLFHALVRASGADDDLSQGACCEMLRDFVRSFTRAGVPTRYFSDYTETGEPFDSQTNDDALMCAFVLKNQYPSMNVTPFFMLWLAHRMHLQGKFPDLSSLKEYARVAEEERHRVCHLYLEPQPDCKRLYWYVYNAGPPDGATTDGNLSTSFQVKAEDHDWAPGALQQLLEANPRFRVYEDEMKMALSQVKRNNGRIPNERTEESLTDPAQASDPLFRYNGTFVAGRDAIFRLCRRIGQMAQPEEDLPTLSSSQQGDEPEPPTGAPTSAAELAAQQQAAQQQAEQEAAQLAAQQQAEQEAAQQLAERDAQNAAARRQAEALFMQQQADRELDLLSYRPPPQRGALSACDFLKAFYKWWGLRQRIEPTGLGGDPPLRAAVNQALSELARDYPPSRRYVSGWRQVVNGLLFEGPGEMLIHIQSVQQNLEILCAQSTQPAPVEVKTEVKTEPPTGPAPTSGPAAPLPGLPAVGEPLGQPDTKRPKIEGGVSGVTATVSGGVSEQKEELEHKEAPAADVGRHVPSLVTPMISGRQPVLPPGPEKISMLPKARLDAAIGKAEYAPRPPPPFVVVTGDVCYWLPIAWGKFVKRTEISSEDVLKLAAGLQKIAQRGTQEDTTKITKLIRLIPDMAGFVQQKQDVATLIQKLCGGTTAPAPPPRQARPRSDSRFTMPPLPPPPIPRSVSPPPPPALKPIIKTGDALKESKIRAQVLNTEASVKIAEAALEENRVAQLGRIPASEAAGLAKEQWTLKRKKQVLELRLAQQRRNAQALGIHTGKRRVGFLEGEKQAVPAAKRPRQGLSGPMPAVTASDLISAQSRAKDTRQELDDLAPSAPIGAIPIDTWLEGDPSRVQVEDRLQEFDNKIVQAQENYDRTGRQNKKKLNLAAGRIQSTTKFLIHALEGKVTTSTGNFMKDVKRRFFDRFKDRYNINWPNERWKPSFHPPKGVDKDEIKALKRKLMAETGGHAIMSDHEYIAMFKIIGAPQSFFDAYRAHMKNSSRQRSEARDTLDGLTNDKADMERWLKKKKRKPKKSGVVSNVQKARAQKRSRSKERDKKLAEKRTAEVKKRETERARKTHDDTAQAMDKATEVERRKTARERGRGDRGTDRSRSRSKRRGGIKEKHSPAEAGIGRKRTEFGGRDRVTRYTTGPSQAPSRRQSVSSGKGPWMKGEGPDAKRGRR